jgi:hypothetical protein
MKQQAELIHDFTIHYPKASIVFKSGYSELVNFYTNQEQETKQFYCDVTQQDWNIIDVGANIGMFTLLFGHLTNGKVWAVEASEENFGMLLENIGHSKPSGSNIIPLNAYVSNKTEKAEGEIHYLWTGRGSVLRNKGEFNFSTLDDLMGDDQHVDLIKIDIDGYDFEAVQGATKIIDRCKPIVVIELVSEALSLHGYHPQQVVDFMRTLNYHETRVLDNCNFVFEFNK